MLQLYRLYVVRAENKKATELKLKQEAQKNSRKKRNKDMNEMNHFNDIYIISNSKCDKKRRGKRLLYLQCAITKLICVFFLYTDQTPFAT